MLRLILPMQCYFARTIILIVVLASLCFSVGEGLRLTPFPVTALASFAAFDGQLALSAANESSVYQYGPLDVPAPAQKRSKRQTIDLGFPPTQIICNFSDHSKRLFELTSVVRPFSRFLVSRAAGRAPPSNS